MADRDLLRGWAIAMTRQVGVGVAGVVWLAVIARTLSPSDVGRLVVLGSLPPLLIPLLTFGIPMALSFLVARGTHSDQALMAWAGQAVRSLVQVAVGLGVLAASVGFAIGATAAVDIASVVIAVPMGASAMVAAAYFQGQRQFGHQAMLMALPFISMAVGAAALGLSGVSSRAPYLIVFAGSYSVAGLVSLACLGAGAATTIPHGILATAWPFAWRSYLSEALAAVRTRADVVIVAVALGSSAAGYFGTASLVAAQLSMLSLAANQVVFPLAASAGRYVADEADDATPRAARLTLWLTLATTLLAAAWSGPMLIALFGPDFLEARPVLLAALPSVVFLSLSRVVTADLYGRGETSTILGISLWGTAISLVLIPVGAVTGGVVGAGLALSAAAGCNASLRVRAYLRLSGCSLAQLTVVRRDDVARVARSLRPRKSLVATGEAKP